MQSSSLIQSIFVAIFLILFVSCDNDELNSLSVSEEQLAFEADGGTHTVVIQTDAGSWSIANPATEWLEISATNGTGKAAAVTFSVSSRTLETRSATVKISAGTAKAVELPITQPASDHLYAINADLNEITFEKTGGSKDIKIVTDAPLWNLSADVAWLQFSKTSGQKGSTTVTVTALENTGDQDKTATITVAASAASDYKITASQKGSLYPSYNTSPLAPDMTGMSSTAVQLAAKINLGWNIGNTLEASGGETAWGNPLVSKALIDLVKQSGFNAVRIPCSWNQYMENSSTAKLKLDWLNRVKEVVQYCVDNDMYVLVNIHWDGGWLENNCTQPKQTTVNAKQKAFWEQIATHLRDFDEHVLFASANEPNVDNSTGMSVLNSYHQTFINAVRSTGGKNSYRTLVVQGPSTDIEKTNNLMLTLSTDPTPNRMMVEVHYYTPWQFCGLTEDASWGKMFYYWGDGYHSSTDPNRNATWGEEADLLRYFGMMKTQFVDKGIPVVLGEYGAMLRSSLTGDALTLHKASRAYFFRYVTSQALAHGMLPFYWDNGFTGNNGSALFNRANNTVFDQQALDALVLGSQ
ncbi:MAG TPA: cellulase family glycosylhydrolase [Chryseosolibacter sp.]|nr:cellulase family glycosylhydrolase [Chryseosolibacter sp.]